MKAVNICFILGMLLCYLAAFVSPESAWWMSLFTYGYPVLLLGNALFVLYWLFRRKSWMYVSLIALLLGLPFHTQFFQLFPNNLLPEDSSSLKVLSYNVRIFDLYDWVKGENTREQIIDLIGDSDADVMCFQEFYHSDIKKGFPTKSEILKRFPDLHYQEFYTHELRGPQFIGGMILSKYPIVAHQNIPFSSDPNNFCMSVDIEVDGKTIRVFNTHLMSFRFQPEDYQFVEEGVGNVEQAVSGVGRIASILRETEPKRSQQTQEVLKAVKESPHSVVLCGDFNATPVSYVYEQFDDQLIDAFTQCGAGIGNTYIGVFPSFRIDYVWHSSDLNSTQYRTLPQKLSDHHPVEVTVYWEEED